MLSLSRLIVLNVVHRRDRNFLHGESGKFLYDHGTFVVALYLPRTNLFFSYCSSFFLFLKGGKLGTPKMHFIVVQLLN